MKEQTYTVNFYYGTDLRYSEDIETFNEVLALSIAMNRVMKRTGSTWVTDPPFRIEIKKEIYE